MWVANPFLQLLHPLFFYIKTRSIYSCLFLCVSLFSSLDGWERPIYLFFMFCGKPSSGYIPGASIPLQKQLEHANQQSGFTDAVRAFYIQQKDLWKVCCVFQHLQMKKISRYISGFRLLVSFYSWRLLGRYLILKESFNIFLLCVKYFKLKLSTFFNKWKKIIKSERLLGFWSVK